MTVHCLEEWKNLKQLNKKIVLVGDPAVGKTSLIRRFVQNSFDDKYIATIGVKVSKKSMSMNFHESEIRLDMMIFDILGQHDFRSLRRMYVDGSDGVIMVGDLTRVESISSIESFWYPEMEKLLGKVPMMLMGNKIDLTNTHSEGVSLLKMESGILLCPFQLCSAKTGEGVEKTFSTIARELIEKHLEKEKSSSVPSAIENIRMAADAIMTHFCEGHENRETAIEICSAIFREAGFKVEEPTKESLIKAIELLAEQDRTSFNNETAERHRQERLKYLATV